MSNVTWAFAEAIRLVDCEDCDAEAGDPCVDRDDNPVGTPHPRRLTAYRVHLGPKEHALRHGVRKEKR